MADDTTSLSAYSLYPDIPIPDAQLVAPADYDQSILDIVNAHIVLEATLKTVKKLKESVYTQEEANGKFLTEAQADERYLREHQDLADYALTTEVNNKISALDNKFQPLGTYVVPSALDAFVKKVDQIAGDHVIMGESNYIGINTSIPSLPGRIEWITFKPRLFDMVTGEVLRTLSVRTKDDGSSFTVVSVVAKIKDVTTGTVFATSSPVRISSYDSTYEFKFNESSYGAMLNVGEGECRVDFYDATSNDPVGLPLCGVSNTDPDIKCNIENFIPSLNLNWYTPATTTVIKAMIAKLAPDYREKLRAIINLDVFGENDYSVEDLRARINIILTTLQGLGHRALEVLQNETTIGEEYQPDDLRELLDKILLAMQDMANK